MRIGVFDSGVGGLTVLKKLIDTNPNNEYYYIGDTLNVPYGNKNKTELFNLSCKIIDYLVSKKVDIIIIACGTVSSNVKDELKNKYKIPILDIISPTIDYLKKDKYKNIGVIATPMTINSKIFSNSLVNKKVYEVPCPKLVDAIEEHNDINIQNCLEEYLKIYKTNKIEILVLGCTHYPIVEKNIQKILKYNLEILNMATPITNILNSIKTKQEIIINFTKLDKNIILNTQKILKDIKYNIDLIKLD